MRTIERCFLLLLFFYAAKGGSKVDNILKCSAVEEDFPVVLFIYAVQGGFQLMIFE